MLLFLAVALVLAVCFAADLKMLPWPRKEAVVYLVLSLLTLGIAGLLFLSTPAVSIFDLLYQAFPALFSS